MTAICYFLLVCASIAIIGSAGGETWPDPPADRYSHVRRALEAVFAQGDTDTRPINTARRSVVNAVATKIAPDYKVSEQCLQDIALMEANRDGKKTTAFSPQGHDWGAQMADSQGNIQAGMFQGHFFWMGDFWECLRIQVWRNGTQTGEPDFKGRYCLTTTQILFLPMPVFKIGKCYPSTCMGVDLQLLAHQSFTFPFNTNYDNNFCQTIDHLPVDSLAVFAITLYGFFFTLIFVATIFELYFIVKRKLAPKSVNFDLGEKSEEQVTLCSTGCSGAFFKELLLAFSAYRNVKQVFNTTRSASDLGAIHGMRTISLSWVVLGHTMLLVHHEFPWKNQLFVAKFNKDFLMQAILAGEFAVDTFFCMSGFLIGYLFLKEMKAKDGKFNIFQYIFHRIWRLTPAYALVILYMSSLYPEIGKGPLWPATDADRTVCREKWWLNLLYINIYFDESVKCLPQAWYLCIDIVFYLVSPIILYPLHKKPLYGQIIFVIFMVISFIVPGALIYKDDLPAYPAWNVSPEARDRFMHDIYDKPWCRITAYLIGMLYGYIFYLKGTKLKLHPLVVASGWMAATAITLSLVYGVYGYSNGTNPMYTGMFVVFGALTRPAWALAVGWVILTCLTGYGGYVNSFLSWKGFLPLSKLSYSMYLVHFTIIAQYYATRPESTYIDFYILPYIAICMFGVSIAVALLLTLVAEAPFIQMEKLISHRARQNRSQTPTNNHQQYTPLPPTDDATSDVLDFNTATNGNGAGRPPPPTRRKFTNGRPAPEAVSKYPPSESENEVYYDPLSPINSGREDSFDDDDDDEDQEVVVKNPLFRA